MKLIRTKKKCPHCPDGFYVYNNEMMVANPFHYIHVCDKCSRLWHFQNKYPIEQIRFEDHEIEEVVEATNNKVQE